MKWILLAPLLLIGCSSSHDWTSVPHQVSDDFFVTVAKVGNSLPGAAVLQATQAIDDKSTCEEHLKLAVCETTASTFEISHNYSGIQCDSNSAQYVPALMDLYTEMPEKMRPSLCSLDRIFLSDQITSVAFASSVTDDFGNRTGGYIGMRKSSFVAQPQIEQLVTWKEQLAWGGSQTFLANDPKLVQIQYGLKMSTLKASGLFYVLMHELGHLIDFNNHINSEEGADTPWSQLSWNGNTPNAADTFYKRDEICYYECRGPGVSSSEALKVYQSLELSAFISAYAAQTPWEDFAETWAWRMMENYKSPDYRIAVPGQGSVDMNELFRSNAKVKAKIRFVDQLWAKPDLVIDNRVQ